MFGKYLFWTNTLSSGILMASGDVIQQGIERCGSRKHKSFDWKRTVGGAKQKVRRLEGHITLLGLISDSESASMRPSSLVSESFPGRMFIVGLAQGPPQHIFYKMLDRSLPRRDYKTIFKKILLDQLIASPVCISIFFIGMGYLEGHTYDEAVSEVKRKFLSVYMVDWLVWPPTQVVNFYFLKPQHRVIYINIMTMIYDIFLSYIKHDV